MSDDDAFDEPEKSFDPQETDDFGTLVSLIDQGGLATWLQDKNNKAWLIQTLHEETSAPKAVVRLILKLLVVPAVKNSENTVYKWIQAKTGSGMKTAIETLLARFPKIKTCLEQLSRDQAERRKADLAVKKAIETGVIDRKILEDPFVNQTDKFLLKQLSETSEISLKLDAIEAALKPQPVLTIEHVNFLGKSPDQLPDHQRLHFAANIIGLHGREDERQYLNDWRDTDSIFSWWLMTGSGGVGKSRLAFEWCLDHESIGWRAGFLKDLTSNIDWPTWQPERPTLIIIDYAQREAKLIGGIIEQLSSRLEGEHVLIFPVRILLLERQRHETWWPQIHSRQTRVQNSFYGNQRKAKNLAQDLELTELRPEFSLAVLKEIVGDKCEALPSSAEAIARLQVIDQQMRPLFIVMAGLEFHKRANFSFTQDELLTSGLEREIDLIWPKTGNLHPAQVNREKNAWVMATLTGGMPCDTFEMLGKENYQLARLLPEYDPYSDTPLSTGFQNLIKNTKSGDFLLPLRPDLLGEWLALTFAGRSGATKSEIDLESLVQGAWGTQALLVHYLWTFIDRIAQDFPERLAEAPALWLKPPQFHDDLAKFARARLVVNLIFRLPQNLIEQKISLLNGIEHLQNENIPEFQLTWARGTVNLILMFIHVDRLQDARKILVELAKLSSTNPNESEIRLTWANGALNLIYAYSDSREIKAARELLNKLVEVSSAYVGEQELQLICVRSTSVLIGAAIQNQKIKTAYELSNALLEFASKHEDEPEIWLCWANCVVDLSSVFRDEKHLKVGYSLLTQLASVSSKLKNQPEIKLAWGKATFNLIDLALDLNDKISAQNLATANSESLYSQVFWKYLKEEWHPHMRMEIFRRLARLGDWPTDDSGNLIPRPE